MHIGILGTGVVGQTIGAALDGKGHAVLLGTRSQEATLARSAPDNYGNPPISVWLKQHPAIQLGSFADAAAHGEVVINATNGVGSLDALRQAGAENLDGKILVDIANPLDFSQGMPPSLTVCNTDSLGEQIQQAFPTVRVVKTLNTMNAFVMVNPHAVAGGDHTVFISGNDGAAKDEVKTYLQQWFGWSDIIDLGDITTARGTEMLLAIWVRLWAALQNPMFNFKVAR